MASRLELIKEAALRLAYQNDKVYLRSQKKAVDSIDEEIDANVVGIVGIKEKLGNGNSRTLPFILL